jgi:hypothetical protein
MLLSALATKKILATNAKYIVQLNRNAMVPTATISLNHVVFYPEIINR